MKLVEILAPMSPSGNVPTCMEKRGARDREHRLGAPGEVVERLEDPGDRLVPGYVDAGDLLEQRDQRFGEELVDEVADRAVVLLVLVGEQSTETARPDLPTRVAPAV